ncbi:MAG: CoA pyrophosphatase [Desulfobacterales bacterium]
MDTARLPPTPLLIGRIADALGSRVIEPAGYVPDPADLAATSAVLVLLGAAPAGSGYAVGEPCLIFNKRSRAVRQPGDLCFAGGGVTRSFDGLLARLVRLPFGPLGRWPHRRRWERENPLLWRWVALYAATALREAFEEMRLNPRRIAFLGPLPPQRLSLFRRILYPIAAWLRGRPRFRPNWEVERIVWVPLAAFLDPANYVHYRVAAPAAAANRVRDVPAFRFGTPAGEEILWGVTFRITLALLAICFSFSPPPLEALPLLEGKLPEDYLTGGLERPGREREAANRR